jgi:two-component system chemotaxis response regulator CheB
VILSGALDDGSAGLRMISDLGGVALVQTPDSALYPGMPDAALAHTPQAHAVPLAELADAICTAVESTPAEAAPAASTVMKPVPPEQQDRSDDNPRDGELTGLTCPECGGALWQHEEGDLTRFKCHVGHAYSPDSLDVSQSQSLESALWAALRSLQERSDLLRRMARRVSSGERLEIKARALDEHATVLRGLVAAFTREANEAPAPEESEAPAPQQSEALAPQGSEMPGRRAGSG